MDKSYIHRANSDGGSGDGSIGASSHFIPTVEAIQVAVPVAQMASGQVVVGQMVVGQVMADQSGCMVRWSVSAHLLLAPCCQGPCPIVPWIPGQAPSPPAQTPPNTPACQLSNRPMDLAS